MGHQGKQMKAKDNDKRSKIQVTQIATELAWAKAIISF